MLQSLVQVHGMGSNGSAAKLIFGGCSAGGRGGMFSLDYVPGILASFGATEVTTVGLLDAALWVDIDPMLPTITSQQCQTASLAVMANATGRMGAACLAAYPGDESWKCLYGAIPSFVASQVCPCTGDWAGAAASCTCCSLQSRDVTAMARRPVPGAVPAAAVHPPGVAGGRFPD